jgi:hypothetical protein
MNYLAYTLIAALILIIARWAWRRLDEALDDVFQTPIHNPYDEADTYGDIPNPHDDH